MQGLGRKSKALFLLPSLPVIKIRAAPGRSPQWRARAHGREHEQEPGLEQLKRFETDPEHYSPAGSPHEAPIYLDAPLAAEFLACSRDVDKTAPPG